MRKKFLFSIFFSILLLINTVTLSFAQESTFQQKWFEKYSLIAHALGGIDGNTYTNSKDALLYNYQKGQRLFEVDFMLTEDGIMVARHGWEKDYITYLQQEDVFPVEKIGKPISYKEFSNMTIMRKYQHLSLEEIIKFMVDHPDMLLITDTKYVDKNMVVKQFSNIVEMTKGIDPEVLDRIVPQIYNQEMLGWIDNVYRFKSMIYTLYSSDDTDNQVVDFVKNKRIDVVTMWTTRANPDFVSRLLLEGVKTYTHTTNNVEEIRKQKSFGVAGFYTDFIYNEDLNVIKKIEPTNTPLITYKGKPLEFEINPIIINGTTFVPMRKLLEINGAQIDWDSERMLVTSRTNEVKIEYVIGDKLINVNNKLVDLPYPGFIKDGITMLPLRFYSEVLGEKLNWNEEKRLISIE
ncbi:stalk domain-containing protein [Paenibacillus sp. V4I7]|uniref:stalk domain-containing protein n=1 Tax=Paenibacillus sp. V4I7 TaxID=3042307 RepID=UPI002784E9B9|nr:stalk domain-containing protein [Paenibacillus sp. V4I7]MDQ0903923.1 glycerophosphoryl diester phosphodiesterase [Paenibacillus sp. V4I7]